MTSEELARTDMGKVLLEQDLQLKRDMAKLLHPDNPKGKEFWTKLYGSFEQGLSPKGTVPSLKKLTIFTNNRVWIVPDSATVVETYDGAFIKEAKLKVLLENEYLSKQHERVTAERGPRFARIPPEAGSTNWGAQQAGPAQAASQESIQFLSESLMQQIIIPEITSEVNSSSSYAPLRQIYYSLILAEYFKQKKGIGAQGLSPKGTVPNSYESFINSGTTYGLESSLPWSKQELWQEYIDSYQKGEYKVKRSLLGLARMYFSGGMAIYPNKSIIGIEKASAGSPFEGEDTFKTVIGPKEIGGDPTMPGLAASPLTKEQLEVIDFIYPLAEKYLEKYHRKRPASYYSSGYQSIYLKSLKDYFEELVSKDKVKRSFEKFKLSVLKEIKGYIQKQIAGGWGTSHKAEVAIFLIGSIVSFKEKISSSAGSPVEARIDFLIKKLEGRLAEVMARSDGKILLSKFFKSYDELQKAIERTLDIFKSLQMQEKSILNKEEFKTIIDLFFMTPYARQLDIIEKLKYILVEFADKKVLQEWIESNPYEKDEGYRLFILLNEVLGIKWARIGASERSEEVERLIRRYMAKPIGNVKIAPETELRDLLTYYNKIQMLGSLEKEFGIDVVRENNEKIADAEDTVQTLIDIVEKELNELSTFPAAAGTERSRSASPLTKAQKEIGQIGKRKLGKNTNSALKKLWDIVKHENINRRGDITFGDILDITEYLKKVSKIADSLALRKAAAGILSNMSQLASPNSCRLNETDFEGRLRLCRYYSGTPGAAVYHVRKVVSQTRYLRMELTIALVVEVGQLIMDRNRLIYDTNGENNREQYLKAVEEFRAFKFSASPLSKIISYSSLLTAEQLHKLIKTLQIERMENNNAFPYGDFYKVTVYFSEGYELHIEDKIRYTGTFENYWYAEITLLDSEKKIVISAEIVEPALDLEEDVPKFLSELANKTAAEAAAGTEQASESEARRSAGSLLNTNEGSPFTPGVGGPEKAYSSLITPGGIDINPETIKLELEQLTQLSAEAQGATIGRIKTLLCVDALLNKKWASLSQLYFQELMLDVKYGIVIEIEDRAKLVAAGNQLKAMGYLTDTQGVEFLNRLEAAIPH